MKFTVHLQLPSASSLLNQCMELKNIDLSEDRPAHSPAFNPAGSNETSADRHGGRADQSLPMTSDQMSPKFTVSLFWANSDGIKGCDVIKRAQLRHQQVKDQSGGIAGSPGSIRLKRSVSATLATKLAPALLLHSTSFHGNCSDWPFVSHKLFLQ